jgi:hypothetical protein
MSTPYQRQVQNEAATFARNAAYNQRQLHNRGRRGRRGPIARLISFVFSLVTIVIALGVLLLIVSAAQPHWLAHLTTWLHQHH